MNNTRRKAIKSVISNLEKAKELLTLPEDLSEGALEALKGALDASKTLLDDAGCDVDDIREEEQEAFDNLLETLQMADKGMTMEDAISALEGAGDNISSALCDIDMIDLDFIDAEDFDLSGLIESIDDAIANLEDAMF